MRKFLVALFALAISAMAQDSSTVLTGSAQPPLPFSLVPQPGFEQRTTGWGISGGVPSSGSFTTAVKSQDPSLVARGQYSGKWTPPVSTAAGVVLQTDAVTVLPGLSLHNCRGQILYMGNTATNGTMNFEAYDDLGNILGSVALANKTSYDYAQTNTFTCPAYPHTLRLRIRNTATTPSSTTALYFDEAFMGDINALNTGGTVTGMGTFGSTPNAQGGTIASQTLTLQPASATFPGGVTTGAQTLAGTKTFSSTPVLSALSTGVLHSDSGGNLSSSGIVSGDIVDGTIVNADINASAAIAATKIGDGSVSTSSFQYLSGATSNIQAQLNAIGPGTAISALTGDVTATGPGSVAATVALVGGSSASNVHSAELLANAATNSNTNSAIVKRDGSGNFSATTITAALWGNASTSTALAANPTDCSANNYATTIDASGNLTCSQVSLSAGVTGVLPSANGGSPTTTKGDLAGFTTVNARVPVGSDGQFLSADSTQTTGVKWITAAGTGTVTSVGFSVPGSSIFGATGSPVTTSGTLGLTVTGTSGGVPYFDTTSTLSTSAALTNHAIVLGGGAGAAPKVLGSLGTSAQVLHGAAAGDPTFGAVALGTDVSGTLGTGSGGTGQTTVLAAFNALSPVTTRGDLITRDATNNVRLGIGAAGTSLGSNGTDASWGFGSVQAQTSNYTLVNTDTLVTGATSGGAFTLTLPTAVGIAGKTFTLVKSDTSSNLLTVATTSSQTLGVTGITSIKMHRQGESIAFVSDGANWQYASQGPARVEYATVACQASSTIISQGGNWISSIGNISSGACTLTIRTGIFSSTPTCLMNYEVNTSSAPSAQVLASSATSVTIKLVYVAVTTNIVTQDTSANVGVTCMGAR